MHEAAPEPCECMFSTFERDLHASGPASLGLVESPCGSSRRKISWVSHPSSHNNNQPLHPSTLEHFGRQHRCTSLWSLRSQHKCLRSWFALGTRLGIQRWQKMERNAPKCTYENGSRGLRHNLPHPPPDCSRFLKELPDRHDSIRVRGPPISFGKGIPAFHLVSRLTWTDVTTIDRRSIQSWHVPSARKPLGQSNNKR